MYALDHLILRREAHFDPLLPVVSVRFAAAEQETLPISMGVSLPNIIYHHPTAR
jgi:hypothetical protein